MCSVEVMLEECTCLMLLRCSCCYESVELCHGQRETIGNVHVLNLMANFLQDLLLGRVYFAALVFFFIVSPGSIPGVGTMNI